MLEHDFVVLDTQGRPLISYGPRRVEQGDGNSTVIGCTPEEAEFWGIYSHPKHDLMATHILDAHDQASAALAIGFVYQSLRLNNAMVGLLDQLEGTGIYIPGTDEGHWAGLEGLSFHEAERVVRETGVKFYSAKELGEQLTGRHEGEPEVGKLNLR